MAELWPRLGKRYFNLELDRVEHLKPPGPGRQSAYWVGFQQRYPNLRLRPLITSVPADRLARIQKRAIGGNPTRPGKDLRRYYVAGFDDTYNFADDLARLRLEAADKSSPLIAVGLVIAGEDPAYDPCAHATLTAGQSYREAKPHGVGAAEVESVNGAAGTDVRIADIERGWDRNHADLADHQIQAPLHGAVEPGSIAHGTSVLGIVAAVDNDIYCVGIAPKPEAIFVASRHTTHVADAILATLSDGSDETDHLLREGDVLLLEVQDELHAENGYWTNTPVENDHDYVSGNTGPVYEAILKATNLGVIVIEAAGNGDVNGDGDSLDQYLYLDTSKVGEGYRDSGAILVAAGEHNGTDADGKCWRKRQSSNHGSRVNCFAQGKGVFTLSYNIDPQKAQCSKGFRATSAASAIVAGVAVSLQGAARVGLGRPLSPTEMRDILSDPKLGTTPCHLLNTKTNIGAMPDLVSAIDAALALDLPFTSSDDSDLQTSVTAPEEPVSDVADAQPLDPVLDQEEEQEEQEAQEEQDPDTGPSTTTIFAQAPAPKKSVGHTRGNALVERILAAREAHPSPWPRDALLIASKRNLVPRRKRRGLI